MHKAEQPFSPSLQGLTPLEKAERWITQVQDNQEALVYLRSRNGDFRDRIRELRKHWVSAERQCLEWYRVANPTHPPVSTANLETLPDTFENFWDGEDCFTDASMLRAAQWCGINGFDPWWRRIERRREALLILRGPVELPWWLFNMARSDLAIKMPLMKQYLDAVIPREYDGSAVIPHWSAVVFAYYRLNSGSSTVITRMVDRLSEEQDSNGAWCTGLNDGEPSIESTAMALHAVALARQTGWAGAAKKSRDWLWCRQDSDGAWREGDTSPTYLTVLILDAINLADERNVLTFDPVRIEAPAVLTPALSNASQTKSAAKRGPKDRSDVYTKVAEIIASQNHGWESSYPSLSDICSEIDELKGEVPLPTRWLNQWQPRPRTWSHALGLKQRLVARVLQDYAKKGGAPQ